MLDNLFSMEGKVCVVTGGYRGLGAFMAQGFLEAGAKRVYVTGRNAKACIAGAEELSKFGECIALPGDVANVEGVLQLVKQLSDKEQHIDVLVNNAGTSWGANFGEFPESGWDKVMDLNVKSPFFLIQALTPLLTKNASAENTAAIINIGSIAGILSQGAEALSYSVSKAAIHQVTKILATELASNHVRVNAIAPGRFYSKMTEFITKDDEAFTRDLKLIPMQRWGEPKDIAGVAVMLASEAGRFITGQIIAVDGGTTLIN